MGVPLAAVSGRPSKPGKLRSRIHLVAIHFSPFGFRFKSEGWVLESQNPVFVTFVYGHRVFKSGSSCMLVSGPIKSGLGFYRRLTSTQTFQFRLISTSFKKDLKRFRARIWMVAYVKWLCFHVCFQMIIHYLLSVDSPHVRSSGPQTNFGAN